MADFCKQCGEYLWGTEFGVDLAGITRPEDTAKGLYASVLCEGCGGTQVDHTGRCIHHSDAHHLYCITGQGKPDADA